MKFIEKLDQAARQNQSKLCVGLDIDLAKLPKKFLDLEDPVFSFNRHIIENTSDLVCAFKPNIAFYEALGIYGLQSLIKTIEFINEESQVPVILDAKRGDVGHTAQAYAKAAFEVLKADAVTVNPYLGHDSLEPFLNYREKGVFVLCLTSNAGFRDFQSSIYLSVARHVKEWNHFGNCGLVVGATSPEELRDIQKIAGDMPILIPGVGAQGGDLKNSVKYGGKRAVINASRSIIYANDPRVEAEKLRAEINAAGSAQ